MSCCLLLVPGVWQVRRKFRQKGGVEDGEGVELAPGLLGKVLGKRKGAPAAVGDD